jgi:hypothetical protein
MPKLNGILIREYVNSANLDVKSSNDADSEENNHSEAASIFSLSDARSSSELTF